MSDERGVKIMKKIIVFALVLTLVFAMASCGPRSLIPAPPDTGSSTSSSSNSSDDSPSSSSSPSKGGGSLDYTAPDPIHASNGMSFDSVNDMDTEFTRLIVPHQDALRDVDPLVISDMTGSDAASFFISSKAKLNPGDEEGRFGDADSENGFYEKNGNHLTFGRDWLADRTDAMFNKGDRLIWNGEADLSQGWAWAENIFQRDGVTYRSYRFDLQYTTDGVVKQFQTGFSVVKSNKYNAFFRVTEDRLDFVRTDLVGEVKDPKGPFRFDANMSAADAIAMFEKEGLSIRDNLSVENGVLTER